MVKGIVKGGKNDKKGFNFEGKDYASPPTGSLYPTLRQQINGSGWIYSIFTHDSSHSTFGLEVDGEVIVGTSTLRYQIPIVLFTRFENNFKLYGPNTVWVNYMLGDTIEEAIPKSTLTRSSSDSHVLRTSVEGSGYIKNIWSYTTGANKVRLDIDGVTVFPNEDGRVADVGSTIPYMPLFWRFNESFEFYTTNNNRTSVYYTLDD